MSTSPKLKVAIIGAGVGGLSSALRLAHEGFDVEVFEKQPGPGGRCDRISFDGFQFDTGPTLLLMPEVFEETFAATGRKMSDYLELVRCEPNYRVHFREGSAITFTSELTRMGEELERVEKGAFEKYLQFLAAGRRQYTTSLKRFVGRNFDSLWQFVAGDNLFEMLRISAHKKMYAHAAGFFKDERLRAALTFQTMYLGISPFKAPAVYGLLPFTELGLGIWFPKGGLFAIPLALEKAAREEGVRFHYGTAVEKVLFEGGTRATGIQLADGREVKADLVLCNADLPWAYKNLIDPEVSKLPRAESLRYTCGAFLMYWGLKRRMPEGWFHHNVSLGADYEGSFDDIFDKGRVPEDPSFYLNVPSMTDRSLAPAGKDGAYVLVPVPHRGAGIDWSVEGPKLRAKVLTRLKELGLDLEADIECERTWTPDTHAAAYNLDMGSAFGLSHDFWQVGPFRPANQDPNVKNLFFVGASTQPGTGLPMVMLSARLATERMVKLGEQLRNTAATRAA